MIKKGSLVRYIGKERPDAWPGKYLTVHERREDKAEVYKKNEKGEWVTFTVSVDDLEEVC